MSSTSTGFRLLVKALTLVGPDIQIQGVDGALSGPLGIRRIIVQTDTRRITLERIRLEWRSEQLTNGRLDIDLLAAQKMTIETYIIRQKAERVKRLIRENELSLKEIAERLHYASLQHLSSQFRKITGLTITQFKKKQFTERSYESITRGLSDLKSRGFAHRFETSGKIHLVSDQQLKKISLKDAKIREVYRFDEKPSGFGQAVIFEIEVNDGAKGYMICQ